MTLGAWIVKWASLFMKKHRELNEIDKEIRGTLKEQVQLTKEHAQFIEEAYQREVSIVRSRLATLDAQLSAISDQLSEREYALQVIENVAATAVEIPQRVEGVDEYFSAVVAVVAKRGTGAPVNPSRDDPTFLALWAAMIIAEMRGTTTAATSIVPAALAEIRKNPRASGEQLRKAVAAGIRALKRNGEKAAETNRTATNN